MLLCVVVQVHVDVELASATTDTLAIIVIATKLSADLATVVMENVFKKMSAPKMIVRLSVNASQAGMWTSLPDHARVRTKLINVGIRAVVPKRVNAIVMSATVTHSLRSMMSTPLTLAVLISTLIAIPSSHPVVLLKTLILVPI